MLINYSKSNLIYAGKVYSIFNKSNYSEKEINYSEKEKEIEILTSQIDDLYMQKNSILNEIHKSEKNLLSYLKIQNQTNPNIPEKNLINLKFQIFFLRKKKLLLEKQLEEIYLEKVYLEIKLRRILSSYKK
ncbi:effector protein ['Cynodon dactylon' phytoplasma]|uniref:effector protein n=1 Tax='Cynodon dactylon' phytoplasma TaxID=295320 RepID=UPI001FCEA39C|nr:effector protein ['Cynodon dactylon' phytoplasma]